MAQNLLRGKNRANRFLARYLLQRRGTDLARTLRGRRN